MTPNRKADLQRKLAMAPIPKPPAGLAERIKSEIPQHLLVDARKERERFSKSIAFNLRIAASVILLIGSVYLALYMLTRADVERTGMEVPKNVVRAKKAAPATAAPVRVAEATAPPVELPKPAPAPAPVEKKETRREVDEVAGGTAAAPPPPLAPPAPPAPVPESVTAEAAPQQITAEAAQAPRAAAKAVGGFVPEAKAAPLALAPSTLFDIVVPRAGAELEGAALIQHFAAPPAPPRALRVDAEATTLGDKVLLRVSVDTPEVAHAVGGSRPPLGAESSLDIVFDEDAVASRRALAGMTHATDSALPSGTSVTALYEVELAPEVVRRATIATVTLRYRAVADGKEHVVTKKVRRSDLRDWDAASRRMKSASLGAALVYGFEPADKIAERARAAGLNELAETAAKR